MNIGRKVRVLSVTVGATCLFVFLGATLSTNTVADASKATETQNQPDLPLPVQSTARAASPSQSPSLPTKPVKQEYVAEDLSVLDHKIASRILKFTSKHSQTNKEGFLISAIYMITTETGFEYCVNNPIDLEVLCYNPKSDSLTVSYDYAFRSDLAEKTYLLK